MQEDKDFLNNAIEILDENKDEQTLKDLHNKLKLFTPIGMDETQSDILWAHAWKSCTYEQACNPSREDIRKCDMIFCKLILKKIEHWL